MQHVALSTTAPRLPRRVSLRHSRPFLSHPSVLRVSSSETPYDSIEVQQEEADFERNVFIREFDKLLKTAKFTFHPGERVNGFVYDVEESGAFIDFGSKEVGYINSYELGLRKVSNAKHLLRPGTRLEFDINVTGVDSKRLGGEVTLLSRTKIIKEIAFKRLRQLCDFQIKLEVDVVDKNAGGYMVQEEMGMIGFLPGKQLNNNPAVISGNDDELIGQKITVRVLDLFEDSGRFLVTQRGILGPEIDEKQFAMGSVIQGVVEGVMPYGVFINTGGMTGLLHMTQISSAPVSDINDVFHVNEPIKAMVLGYDRQRSRLSLSTKKLEPKSGDMLKNKELVFEKAEEMAAKFRKEVELAAARIQSSDYGAIVSDVSLNTSRLATREDSL